MIDESFIRNLGIIVVAAAVFLFSTRPLKMPSIVVYLVAGVIVGPVLGLVELSGALELISEMGIVLLLFLVGLELSLDKIRDVGRVAMLAGLSQVAMTALLGFGFCWLLDFRVMESLFLAAAVTFSSTVVVVKLLDEKRELYTLYGRIAVGIFLVQDLVVIVLLTFLSGYDPNEKMNLASVGKSLGLAFGGMGVLLVLVLGAARYLLGRPFAWAARSGETLFIWSLCWCFLVVLVAHWMHLSHEIGAFLAGISLAQLPHTHELQRRVHPLMNFFIAVFFVSLGVQMNLEPAFRNWGSALLLSGFVLIGKMLIFVWIITRLGFSRKTSFLTSVTVAQISEFSFILAAMGIKAGLIADDVLSMTALIGLITISVSSYLILYNHDLYRLVHRWNLLRWFGTAREDEPEIVTELRGHIIVVGMNTLGRNLVRRLCERGEQVLAIDTDPQKLAGLPCATLHGNVEYESLLEEAGLSQAKLLISALQVEGTNDILAHRAGVAGIPCCIHVIDLSVVDNLLDMNVTYLMIPKVDGVKLQNRELERRGLLR